MIMHDENHNNIKNSLDSKLRIGYSKYQDKKFGITNDYLKTRFNLAPYTIKLEACSLAKLYSCYYNDFISIPKRDKLFSQDIHKYFIDFCKSTGLRRKEITSLKGNQLILKNGNYYIRVIGKGGHYRELLVINNIDLVVKLMSNVGNNKVFKSISINTDIHSCRADYYNSLYNIFARDIKTLPKKEIYCFRNELAGVWYDKQAMLIASHNLGHNRISVITEHYLYKL